MTKQGFKAPNNNRMKGTIQRRYVSPHESTSNHVLLFKQGTLRQDTLNFCPLPGPSFQIEILPWHVETFSACLGSSSNKEYWIAKCEDAAPVNEILRRPLRPADFLVENAFFVKVFCLVFLLSVLH